MNVGDICEVTIEKYTNSAVGLARIDGVVVFIPDSCPEDVLKIEITKVNKNFCFGKILEIIWPSIHRAEPFCPMQKVCGACQIQYIDYDYQLKIKQGIVQDSMNTIANLNISVPMPVKSPEIKSFRHKIQYPVSETKKSKRILAGYYKPASHEIVNIKYCPIQPDICDEIIDYIRNIAGRFSVSGYDEKSHSGILRHIIIRSSFSTKKNLVCLVLNSSSAQRNIQIFCKDIFERFDCVSGVCVNYNSKKTNVILGNKTECICGDEFIEETISGKTFLIGADTFFQINPESAQNIFNYVKNYISQNYKNASVLDAYAGISAFGICVSDVCGGIVSIEENSKSVELACMSAQINHVNNIEIHGGDAGQFFKSEKRKFDVIILDPPRKGCTCQSLDDAVRLCRGSIVYVSCNPATLARDLKYLVSKGCCVESVQPFDMFCHTCHIENVVIIDCPKD